MLVGRSDELGAEDALDRGGAARPAREPARNELQRGRERSAVEAVDDFQYPILVVALDRAAELAHPGALLVAATVLTGQLSVCW